METSDARGSPPEDGGLWMKLDSDELPQGTGSTAAPEGADDVFVPPPPEGSTEPSASNSRVTLSNQAADATEAEANPSSLDWPHGEKQLMAAQVEAVTVNTGHTESEDIERPSANKTADQDTAGLTETCRDHNRGDGDLTEQPEDKSPQQATTMEENQNEAHEPESEDGFTASDSNARGGNPDCDHEGTNTVCVSDEASSDTCNQMGRAASDAQMPPIPADVTDDDALNHKRRETHLPTAEEEAASEQGGGSGTIATDIQRGEQLLQRLQLVQQRQDAHMSPNTVRQAAGEAALGPREETKEDQTEEDLEQDHNQGTSSKPEDQGAEAKGLDEGEAWVCVLPAPHRSSALQASEEIRDAAHRTQNLQRPEGVFSLSDDPDVLEIPFQTSISLGGQSQRSPWHISEQRMQEISVKVQRERVLVNQGKIPGGSGQGEVRHPETQLLFQAFQQGNTEGPTRLRKSASTVDPSVLERTRSLETFALKSCPIPRAQSLRLDQPGSSERERPENVPSKSPTLGPREKTRLWPYPTKDKHLHASSSVDSLGLEASTPAAETSSQTREDAAGLRSPILTQNPFFKLRPALALQPEVEKDIREAREREEELRRQRCTLYGDKGQEAERSQVTQTPQVIGAGLPSAGKLERVWPPPCGSEQASGPQQERRAHRAGGPKAPLWQRWESGRINGQQDDG